MKDEFFDPPKVMTCDPSKEIDSALLAYYISKHKAEISRYEMLWKMYRGRHAIVDAEEKDSYKPDNRIVANFARYVVETFNGYFMGKPVTVSHEDPELSKQVNRLMKLNDQDDNNAELSKLVRIYGRAYEFLYQNENTETCITYNSPLDMFMVYDDTIAQRPFLPFVTISMRITDFKARFIRVIKFMILSRERKVIRLSMINHIITKMFQ